MDAAEGNSRRAAAFALARWKATGDFAADRLPAGPDRAFVQDLVYTSLRRLRPLRLVLGKLVSRWPRGELEALLYVGVAQLLYMRDVPDFAAVNETVEAAKRCASPSIARVVNGVLRNLLRRREEFEAMVAASPLEVRESFPTGLVDGWRRRFGEDGARRLCEWHNAPAETFLAFPDRYERLPRGVSPLSVEALARGECIVQDPGMGAAVDLLDPQPGERVLDACAAPGGKTVRMAWRGADVTACEVNPRRFARLEDTLRRTGLSGKVRTIREFDQCGTFDKVLVDAPCANTGVLRRRPEARWGWSREKVAAMSSLQARILDAAAPHVAEGGVLVYSTCSNEPDENQRQAEAFLARHPEFAAGRQVESVPFETGHDGAFAAAFVRSGPEGRHT